MLGANDDNARVNWRKATRSKNYGDCVEVSGGSGIIATRDSKDRLGPVIRYPASSWQAFIFGTKSGDFDALR
jgi:hypothetical protein